MKFRKQYIELAVLAVILYSVLTHVLALEFDPEEESSFFILSEIVIAAFFTIEYVVRWIGSKSLSYPLRPMAIVDLLATLPFYLGFMADLRSLRLIRILRVFRLFRVYRYTNALQSVQDAFWRVRYEFGVTGFAVFTLAWIASITLYELEKTAQPQAFGKVSDSFWFTLTTLTTVGYGDKVPVTLGGRLVAVVLMVAGLGMFGTFVSLIGGAFLEELRKNGIKNTTNEPPLMQVGTTYPEGGGNRKTLVVSSDLFDRLSAAAEQHGVADIGQLLEQWQNHDDETRRSAALVQRAEAVGGSA